MSAIQQAVFAGGVSRTAIAITISANTNNYVLNVAKASGYVAGKSDITLTINSGVFVGSTSTGAYALQIDTSWNAADTVSIVNNGNIGGLYGAGGQGSHQVGSGKTAFFVGAAGGAGGGPALNVLRAITMNNLGTIGGGGGGGGGGGLGYGQDTLGMGATQNVNATGGDGGAGAGVNSGFIANVGGTAGGSAGTYIAAQGGTGGTGGTQGSGGGTGGTGGTLAGTWTAGAGGGGSGNCIVGNSFITYTAVGTRLGGIS
jgi:hypothetical protein